MTISHNVTIRSLLTLFLIGAMLLGSFGVGTRLWHLLVSRGRFRLVEFARAL